LETTVERSESSRTVPTSYPVVVGKTYPVVGLAIGPPGFYAISGGFVYYYKADERAI
jgi:hypothetical protein